MEGRDDEGAEEGTEKTMVIEKPCNGEFRYDDR